MKNKISYRGKRAIDVVASLLAVMILSPLLIAIAILIKVFDPGSIIFKQKRIGRNGDIFLFYKFRSMPESTGNLPSDKIGQIELTWIGKFIRRTNIDELPQLFNIIKGDMSLVGPRPPIPSQEELIKLRLDNESIFCLPGLTGFAQIMSYDGMSIKEKAAFDGDYAKKISLKFDILIVLKTFSYLLKPPPVY